MAYVSISRKGDGNEAAARQCTELSDLEAKVEAGATAHMLDGSNTAPHPGHPIEHKGLEKLI